MEMEGFSGFNLRDPSISIVLKSDRLLLSWSTHCNPKNLARLVLRSTRISWMLISTGDTNRMFITVLVKILIVLIFRTASEIASVAVVIVVVVRLAIVEVISIEITEITSTTAILI